MSSEVYNKNYIRKIDKNQIPTCNILGVNIAAIDMQWLLGYLKENLCALSGDYMCVANVHTTVTAFEDSDYLKIQNSGVMAIPDGGPLSVVGRMRGHGKMQRTTGPDLMGEMFEISGKEKYRHYFYGSTEETIAKLRRNLEKKYPKMVIAGMYSPPFRKMTPEEDEKIIREINEAKPDIIWVGLGAPKQECWMAEHQGKLCGLMIGVGAGFDYYAGNIKRAPLWMQKANLEWLYRFVQAPKKLFKRYWHTNTSFIWNVMIRGK